MGRLSSYQAQANLRQRARRSGQKLGLAGSACKRTTSFRRRSKSWRVQIFISHSRFRTSTRRTMLGPGFQALTESPNRITVRRIGSRSKTFLAVAPPHYPPSPGERFAPGPRTKDHTIFMVSAKNIRDPVRTSDRFGQLSNCFVILGLGRSSA